MVVPFFKYVHMKKGEYIFKEGEPSRQFFCILKGKISIRKGYQYILRKGIFNYKIIFIAIHVYIMILIILKIIRIRREYFIFKKICWIKI